MISCTEFIPLYSEFFKYLEAIGTEEAVHKYWKHISDNSIGDGTNPNSLRSFMERDPGVIGAWKYWSHTLTEEACDLFRFYNPKKDYYYLHMRHCPSRGRLNAMSHIEPYHNYCGHCDAIYKYVLKEYGVIFEGDYSKVDNAECFEIIYKEGNRPEGDYTIPDEDCLVMDLKAEDNKYLHKDFHLSGDLALAYCAENYGYDALIGFLDTYVKNYYSPVIGDVKKRGLIAVKEWIERVYEIEEASEVLHTRLSDDILTVNIDKSPAIEFMYSLGQKPSRYYCEETKTLYKSLAEAAGIGFELIEYDDATGRAAFKFTK